MRKEELELAEQARATTAYSVLDRYEVVDGVIRAAPPFHFRRHYFPMGAPHMVSGFARLELGDANAALRFVKRWGLLGYERLAAGVDGGDPLSWIWAHVNGVRIALEVAKLINGGNDEKLEDYISSLGGSPYGYGVRQQILSVSELAALARPLGNAEPIISGAESVLLKAIINPNLKGVYLQLWDAAPTIELARAGRYHLVYEWAALINVIYRHVADIVVGGRVRICDSCGFLSRQTHGRQRFCPAESGQRSLCEMRFTTARQRRKS